MGSDIDALASALNIGAGDVTSFVTGPFSGGGIFMLIGITVLGIAARPIFVLIMSTVRFRNPMAESSGSVWILTAIGMIVIGLMLSGRDGRTLQMAESNLVSPFRINLLHQDVCDPAQETTCMLVRVDAHDLWVHGFDKRGFWAPPFAMGEGWRHLHRPEPRPEYARAPDAPDPDGAGLGLLVQDFPGAAKTGSGDRVRPEA